MHLCMCVHTCVYASTYMYVCGFIMRGLAPRGADLSGKLPVTKHDTTSAVLTAEGAGLEYFRMRSATVESLVHEVFPCDDQ